MATFSDRRHDHRYRDRDRYNRECPQRARLMAYHRILSQPTGHRTKNPAERGSDSLGTALSLNAFTG